MKACDNDRGRELLAALQRGLELSADDMAEFLAWVDHRDTWADTYAYQLKQQKGAA